MTQRLRALVNLQEDLGLIITTHMAAHNCNSSPMGSNLLLWHPQALGHLHAVHRHTWKQSTHTRKINTFLKVKKQETNQSNKPNQYVVF